MSELKLEIRTAARLILLDDERRILLFLHTDGHGRQFWATPGGGLEPGETIEQAARREAAEELGLEQVELQLLWQGHSDFQFADRSVSQDEFFFLVRSHSVLFAKCTDEVHRNEGILEARWWQWDDLESSSTPLFPNDLASRLRALAWIAR